MPCVCTTNRGGKERAPFSSWIGLVLLVVTSWKNVCMPATGQFVDLPKACTSVRPTTNPVLLDPPLLAIGCSIQHLVCCFYTQVL